MKTLHQRRARQRGMMSMVVGEIALVLVFFLIMVLIMGHLTLRRNEQQNATDAVNFAAGIIAKYEGVTGLCDDNRLMQIALLNLPEMAPGQVVLDCDDPTQNADGTRVRFATRVTTAYQSPFNYDDGRVTANAGVDRITVRAVTELTQQEMSDPELPKVVFVLDYSGSMGAAYGGSSRIRVLRDVVNRILDLDLPVEFGLVLFNRSAFASIDIRGGADHDDIRDQLEVREGENTNYEAGLGLGTELLRRRGAEKGYLIFMTDGAPTEGDRTAAPARRVWNAGYTTLPVFIGPNNNNALLISMAGSREDPANPNFYFEAADPNALIDAMDAVFRTILCSLGPIDPAPSDADDLGLILRREDNTEVGMERVLNPRELSEPGDRPKVLYNPADQYIKISEEACNEILYEGAKVVARHGSAILLE